MNQVGIDLLKHFEGCTLSATWDMNGWEIGYGEHGPDIVQGTVWTQEQCDQGLLDRVAMTEKALDRLLMVPVTENQYAALVCLAWNIGLGAFSKSTLLRYLNDGDAAMAALQFAAWDKVAGAVNAGLVARRKAEADLFLLPDAPV